MILIHFSGRSSGRVPTFMRHVLSTLPAWLVTWFAALALGLFSLSAAAQLRDFPPDSKRGVLFLPVGLQGAKISDNVYRYAPGVQFRDPENFLMFPEDYIRYTGTAVVRYSVDPYGELFRVWFLTKAEAAQVELEEKAKPKIILPDPDDFIKNKPLEKPEDVLNNKSVTDASKPKSQPSGSGGSAQGAAGGAQR